MRKTFLYFLTACLFLAACSKKPKEAISQITMSNKHRSTLKKLPIQLTYKLIHPVPVMKNLHMIGKVGKYGVDGDMGKILRVLQYENIARAVEARYQWLGADTLLGMIAQEDGGVDLLPNAKNDGGFGTIHTQPELAVEYGLHTYKGCDKMVCKKHALALKKLIKKGTGRDTLTQDDDRLNPLQNLDAVARMLSYSYYGRQLPGRNSFQTAIFRYGGKKNYPKYYNGVLKFVALLHDPIYLKKVEDMFNALNPDLTINGKKADFKKYMEVSRQQNENYDLDDYKKLGPWALK
jgi:hypothetical protein